MNYEQKLKNYLHLNKCQNDIKLCERNLDRGEILSNNNKDDEMDSSGGGVIREKMKRNLENRFEYNSTNYVTKCFEKNNESEMLFDDSLKIEMRNYKRLIEDCLDFDLPHVKKVKNIQIIFF
jgi:hypothetical protein